MKSALLCLLLFGGLLGSCAVVSVTPKKPRAVSVVDHLDGFRSRRNADVGSLLPKLDMKEFQLFSATSANPDFFDEMVDGQTLLYYKKTGDTNEAIRVEYAIVADKPVLYDLAIGEAQWRDGYVWRIAITNHTYTRFPVTYTGITNGVLFDARSERLKSADE